MAIVVSSSTDTQEQVNHAAGLTTEGKDPVTGESGVTTQQPAEEKQPVQASAVVIEEPQRKKGGFQRTIERQRDEIAELRERVARFEGRTEAGGQRTQASAETDPEPKATDAKYANSQTAFEDYHADRTRWIARQEF